jgi:hypothetical protein
MLIYATAEELRDFMHGEGSSAALVVGAHALLRKASELMLDYTASAIYSTDADGYPVDSVKRQAFRSAACAQTEAWVDAGVTPGTLAVMSSRLIASKSLGGRSVAYEVNGAATAERNNLASGRVVVATAIGYLSRAGLLTTRVVSLTRGSTLV